MRISIRRALCVAFIAFFLLCISAIPASAHAVVESTNPYNGQELVESPEQITIRFSENVETRFGSLRLFNEEAQQVKLLGSLKAEGKTISQRIPDLKRGTYVVAWNVISGDTHPVRGSFTFSVNSALNSDITSNENLEKILDTSSSRSVTVGLSVTRFFVFISLAVLIALIFLRTFLVTEIPRPLLKIFNVALSICVVFSLASLFVYVANAREYSLFSLSTMTDLTDEASSRFGIVAFIRIALCFAVYCIWKFRQKINRVVGGLLCIFLASTLAFAGHASVGTYSSIALGLDVIHVLAASIWLGGLVSLPFFLSNNNGIEVAKKFSRVATVCVIAIATSGLFAWWRQIGSIDASKSTWFGQIVSVKSFLFIATIAIALFSRHFVRSLTKSDDPHKKKLMRCIYAETILLIIVMAASSVLVGSIPGKSALAAPTTFHKSVSTGYIDITVSPAKVGPTDIHVYMLNKNGTPFQVSDTGASLKKEVMTVTMSNRESGVTALPVAMKFQGLNHFVSVGANFPFTGEWIISIRVRVSEFDEIVTSAKIQVHP